MQSPFQRLSLPAAVISHLGGWKLKAWFKYREDNYESFSNISSGVQSLAVALGFLLSGLWAATTLVELSEKNKNIAEMQESQLRTESLKRALASNIVVNTGLSASLLSAGRDGYWVKVEASFHNSGNDPIRLDFKEAITFYIAKVDSIPDSGIARYANRKNLRFDYADKTIDWIMLRPGASIEKMHAIQKLEEPGIYLVRLAISARDEAIGEDREFSSDTYLSIGDQHD